MASLFDPATPFSESGRPTDFLRLTYTEKEELDEEVRRLAEAAASFNGG